jgi:hypothetical protein
MGLVISDSFKTVVTIYILIPFLVIPQIILSGIIVKFEKINPKISSPTSIPWYGEIITARWAYEALATYEFINNEYQSQFYMYDKVMSETRFRRDFWVIEMRNRVDNIERYKDNPEHQESIEENLLILRNEINKELKNNDLIPFNRLDDLTVEGLSTDVLADVRDYLDNIRQYNVKLYNKASDEKNLLVNEMQKTEEAEAEYLRIKREHNNESLEEFAKNSNAVERIIQVKDQLYQKIDPIYMDPAQKFIKAHFYAPRKQIFGSYYSTFAVNTVVIWFMTICLYLILYFRLLKKLLDFFEELSNRLNLGRGE